MKLDSRITVAYDCDMIRRRLGLNSGMAFVSVDPIPGLARFWQSVRRTAWRTRMKSEHYTRCVVLILVLSFIPAIVSASEGPGDTRKSAARLMVKEFSRLRIHKLYVPDFCGGSSHPNPHGAFFAAEFSKLLTETAKNFVVQSRVEAHRFLVQSRLTDCDLIQPEVLSKLSSNFGMDCLLSADRSADKNSYTMDFVLRDLSGKELSRFHYSEPAYPETEGLFPATAAPAGWPYYFAFLDGVGEIRGVYMPNPGSLSRGTSQQNIVVSAVIDTDGKVSDVRIIRGRSVPEIDDAIERIKSWRMVPIKGPDGSAVSVRFPISFYF
jgi:TonB family protein